MSAVNRPARLLDPGMCLTLRPMATFGVMLANVLEVSYGLEIDPSDGGLTHRVLFGINW